jgi:hypothetical protein
MKQPQRMEEPAIEEMPPIAGVIIIREYTEPVSE